MLIFYKVWIIKLNWIKIELKLLSRERAKKGLSIIWPGISYETALDKAALSSLSNRRTVSCIKFIGKVRSGNPLYPLIHSLRARSPIWASEASLARMRERGAEETRVLARLVSLVSLAQIGELARRLTNTQQSGTYIYLCVSKIREF